jgi:hypothetical protein
MVNISAAMAAEFTKLTEQMREKLETMGPNPLKTSS